MNRVKRSKAPWMVHFCTAIASGMIAFGTSLGDEKGNTDFATLQAEAKKSFEEGVGPFAQKYCTECHGKGRKKAGLNFDEALKKPGNPTYRKHWKQAVANVKAFDMPPDDADEMPTEKEREQFIEWIEKLKYLSPKDPGPFVIRRLTKDELGNTLHDLFGVDRSVVADLPDEVFGAGYLNNLSSLQSEQYLGIANEVVERPEVQALLRKKVPAEGENLRDAARVFARDLARKCYRRPPTEAEIEVLLQVFDLAQANKLDYEKSLRLVTKAILISPQFLFITPSEEAPSDQKIVPLDGYQLASRLSYLLWATIPDSELYELAENGTLQKPEILRDQVTRMIADPRSRALFDGFGAQWLGLNELEAKTFDREKFPEMTRELRAAMHDEARLFFESILRENQSIVRFVDSNYTFLNESLASLYGLEEAVKGPEMRKVSLPDQNRGGILGMPAVLATTSFPNRTSPVIRGVWVMEQVLGEEIPPAPANVPELEKQDQATVANMTMRQRTELHVTNATCANCHKILDPIGFGLENFDAIGRWREKDDSGGAIDAAGELPGGESFSSPAELKTIIARRKKDMARNLTEKLLAYALCRPLEGYDEIVVDHLMATIEKEDYRMQSLVREIVTSYPFTQRRIRN